MKIENNNNINKTDSIIKAIPVLYSKQEDVHHIHLFVKVDEKQLFDVAVNVYERVRDILERILSRGGINSLNMQLMHNGSYLNDELSVEQCCLEDGAIVNLMHGLRGGMQIYVKNIEGKVYTIEVSPKDTVQHIKNKIYEKSGYTPVAQRLVFKGKCLNDEQCLVDVGIESNSEINLVIRKSENITVLCKVHDGSNIEAIVQLTDKVNDLKVNISEQTGMLLSDVEVIFDKRILRDSDTIKECGLIQESSVDVVAKKNSNLVIYLMLALIILLLAYEFGKWFS